MRSHRGKLPIAVVDVFTNLILFYYDDFFFFVLCLSLPWLIHKHTHAWDLLTLPKNKQINDIAQYKNQLPFLSRTRGQVCAVVNPCYNQHKKNNKYLQQLWAVGFSAADWLPPNGSWCCSLNLTQWDMWGGQGLCCRGGDCPECWQITLLTRMRCEVKHKTATNQQRNKTFVNKVNLGFLASDQCLTLSCGPVLVPTGPVLWRGAPECIVWAGPPWIVPTNPCLPSHLLHT